MFNFYAKLDTKERTSVLCDIKIILWSSSVPGEFSFQWNTFVAIAAKHMKNIFSSNGCQSGSDMGITAATVSAYSPLYN